MSSSTEYIPGEIPDHNEPLGRFLPPIPMGVAPAWLKGRLQPGAWVLDPFGSSPYLPVEAAQAGYRVLVAANNPIARFLLDIQADPPAKDELRAALADLAASQKGDERIEPHTRSLYLTECENCTQTIEAQAYVWERGGKSPTGRIYHCPKCQDSGERPANSRDLERAADYSTSGLHRARALERVASINDPDRQHAEEALEMYPARAMYALITLVNKLESFPPERRRLLSALLLATFDQSNVLWHHPATRSRPRQLVVPTRYLEKNIWHALEGTVDQWIDSIQARNPDHLDTPFTMWPELPPPNGGICVFEGRLKDLATRIQSEMPGDFQIEAVLTALPRPNQAFWTLSALWAGWLWGHEASDKFKSVLRRRRYDWSWHTTALNSAFHYLAYILEPGTPSLGLIGELESGFLSAAVISAGLENYNLEGLALRADSEQAQINWRKGENILSGGIEGISGESDAFHDLAWEAAIEYLGLRGEPASYIYLHGAVLSRFAQNNLLKLPDESSPAEFLKKIEDSLEGTFKYRGGFSRYGGSSRTLEAGKWWLDQALIDQSTVEVATPLADRVEMKVVQFLQQNAGCSLEDVDTALCAAFGGLFTPEADMVKECLHSYGEQIQPGSDQWIMRAQESPQRRRTDMEEMELLLEDVGNRLGYQVMIPVQNKDEQSISARSPIIWRDNDGSTAYLFYIFASGVFGDVVQSREQKRRSDPGETPDQPSRDIIIIPGGRARLIGYKLSNDPRLRSAIEKRWRFVKFRHVRFLAENEGLNRDNLDEQLDLDPLANRDPQMPLL